MNIGYMLYQAERTRSAAEQRQIDTQAGELAAAIARRGRAGRRTVVKHQRTGRQGTWPAGRPATPAAVSCAVSSPR